MPLPKSKRRRLDSEDSKSDGEVEWRSDDDHRPEEKSTGTFVTTKDSSSEDDSVPNQGEVSSCSSRSSTIRLSSALLRLIFTYADYEQLAHQLPVVCQKWYRIVCYSDGLWTPHVEMILNSKSATDTAKSDTDNPNSENNKSVFRQPQENTIQPVATHHSHLCHHLKLTTTVGSNRARNKKPSSTRREFIFAYRRHILCEHFFREMGIMDDDDNNNNVNKPRIDPNVKEMLQQFQKESKIRLPLTFFHLLAKSKIHRYIPHLWYANLKYNKLDCMNLSNNRILLHWLSDCQGCWSGFILFDKDNPTPDPPVYSETEGVNFTFGFHDFIRRYNNKNNSCENDESENEASDAARIRDDAELVESQLALESVRLSTFLEKYAIEAKHWDMDDANSSLQEEAADDLNNQEDVTSDSDDDDDGRPRRSKRLKASIQTRSISDNDGNDDEVEYEDFGWRHEPSTAMTNNSRERGGSAGSSSSEEAEWQDDGQ